MSLSNLLSNQPCVDPQLSHLILSTYNILNNNESQLMKDTYLDLLLENLVNKKILYKREKSIQTLPNIALKLKEILHEKSSFMI